MKEQPENKFQELVDEPQVANIKNDPKLSRSSSQKISNPSFANLPINIPESEKKLTSSHIADIKTPEACPLIKAIYYSPYYKYFYFALLILTVFLTIWLVIDYKNIRRIFPVYI